MMLLEPLELECLAWIAGVPGERPWSGEDAVIRRLLALGLVEETVQVDVMLPALRRSLRVTAAGRAALEAG